MSKVPIDWSQLTAKQCLTLARRAIREFNEQNLYQYKIVEK